MLLWTRSDISLLVHRQATPPSVNIYQKRARGGFDSRDRDSERLWDSFFLKVQNLKTSRSSPAAQMCVVSEANFHLLCRLRLPGSEFRTHRSRARGISELPRRNKIYPTVAQSAKFRLANTIFSLWRPSIAQVRVFLYCIKSVIGAKKGMIDCRQ